MLSLQPRAFINEIHYDNVGVDTGEAVEIAAAAGTDLTGWTLVFYNGFDGMVYRTEPLSGVVPVGILAAATALAHKRGIRGLAPGAGFLLGCFVLPLVLAGLVSYADQVIYYRPRFSLLLVPIFSIALAWACCSLGSSKRNIAAVSACALLLVAGVVAQITTPQKRAWRETALDWPRVDAPRKRSLRLANGPAKNRSLVCHTSVLIR